MEGVAGLRSWTVDQVADWVSQQGPELVHLAPAFVEHGITGAHLYRNAFQDFLEHVEGRVLVRVRLHRALARLKERHTRTTAARQREEELAKQAELIRSDEEASAEEGPDDDAEGEADVSSPPAPSTTATNTSLSDQGSGPQDMKLEEAEGSSSSSPPEPPEIAEEQEEDLGARDADADLGMLEELDAPMLEEDMGDLFAPALDFLYGSAMEEPGGVGGGLAESSVPMDVGPTPADDQPWSAEPRSPRHEAGSISMHIEPAPTRHVLAPAPTSMPIPVPVPMPVPGTSARRESRATGANPLAHFLSLAKHGPLLRDSVFFCNRRAASDGEGDSYFALFAKPLARDVRHRMVQSWMKRMLGQSTLRPLRPEGEEGTSANRSAFAMWRPFPSSRTVRLFCARRGKVTDHIDNSGKYAEGPVPGAGDDNVLHRAWRRTAPVPDAKVPTITRHDGFIPVIQGGYHCTRRKRVTTIASRASGSVNVPGDASSPTTGEGEDEDVNEEASLPPYGLSDREAYSSDSEWDRDVTDLHRERQAREERLAASAARSAAGAVPGDKGLPTAAGGEGPGPSHGDQDEDEEEDIPRNTRALRSGASTLARPAAPALTQAEILAIIESEKRRFRERWREMQEPKLWLQAYRLYHRKLSYLRDMEMELQDLLERRLIRQVESFELVFFSASQHVVRMCSVLEPTICSICELEFFIALVQGPEPAKPVRPAKPTAHAVPDAGTPDAVGARTAIDDHPALAEVAPDLPVPSENWDTFFASEDEEVIPTEFYELTGLVAPPPAEEEAEIPDLEESGMEIEAATPPVGNGNDNEDAPFPAGDPMSDDQDEGRTPEQSSRPEKLDLLPVPPSPVRGNSPIASLQSSPTRVAEVEDVEENYMHGGSYEDLLDALEQEAYQAGVPVTGPAVEEALEAVATKADEKANEDREISVPSASDHGFRTEVVAEVEVEEVLEQGKARPPVVPSTTPPAAAAVPLSTRERLLQEKPEETQLYISFNESLDTYFSMLSFAHFERIIHQTRANAIMDNIRHGPNVEFNLQLSIELTLFCHMAERRAPRGNLPTRPLLRRFYEWRTRQLSPDTSAHEGVDSRGQATKRSRTSPTARTSAGPSRGKEGGGADQDLDFCNDTPYVERLSAYAASGSPRTSGALESMPRWLPDRVRLRNGDDPGTDDDEGDDDDEVNALVNVVDDDDELVPTGSSPAGARGRGRTGRRDIRPIVPLDRKTLLLQQNRFKQRDALLARALEQSKFSSPSHVIINLGHDESEEHIFIPEFLGQYIKPHQVTGVQFLWKNLIMLRQDGADGATPTSSGCILAHAMGLGKTFQLICFLYTLFVEISRRNPSLPPHLMEGRVMIVMPPTLLANWDAEFHKWIPEDLMPHLGSIVRLGMEVSPGDRLTQLSSWANSRGILLIGYEMLKNLAREWDEEPVPSHLDPARPEDEAQLAALRERNETKALARSFLLHKASLVICDEGHVIKNPNAKIYAIMKSFETPSRVCLTGYPLQNNLTEYWTMIDFVYPGFMGTLADFKNNFEVPIINGSFIDSTVSDKWCARRQLYVLNSLIQEVVLRLDTTPLIRDLPEKSEFVIVCRPTQLQLDLYRLYLAALPAASYSTPKNIMSHASSLIRICNHPAIFKRAFDVDGAPGPAGSAKAEALVELEDEESEVAAVAQPLASTSEGAGVIVVVEDSDSGEDGAQGAGDTCASATTVERSGASTSTLAGGGQGGRALTDAGPGMPAGDALMRFVLHDGNTADGGLRAGVDLIFNTLEDYESMVHSHKLQIVLHLIELSLRHKDKILVFSQSIPTLNFLRALLKQRGIPHLEIRGNVPTHKRSTLINKFNLATGLHGVFLISTRSGSVGVNLVSANRIILVDGGWNPSHDEQAIARAYRYGQTKHVYIYRLQCADTFETKLYKNNVQKVGLSKHVVDKKSTAKNFTRDEMRRYFEEPRELEQITPDDSVLRSDPILPALYELDGPGIIAVERHEDMLREIEEDMTDEQLAESHRLLSEERLKRRALNHANSLAEAAAVPPARSEAGASGPVPVVAGALSAAGGSTLPAPPPATASKPAAGKDASSVAPSAPTPASSSAPAPSLGPPRPPPIVATPASRTIILVSDDEEDEDVVVEAITRPSEIGT